MRGPVRRFVSTFTLVSRIPVRAQFEPDYKRTDFWLPLIGPLASAFALAGLGLGMLVFRDPLLSAILALVMQYGAFNLFHLDGLLDSADAMFPFASPARRLEILKDSRIGSYAFAAGFGVLAAKTAALARLMGIAPNGGAAITALLAAPVAGRAAAALVPCCAPPARSTGLGAKMRGFSVLRVAFGFALALAPLAVWAMWCGASAALCAFASALGAALLAGFGMARLYRRRTGGFTGDALGAAVELGELCTLLALAAILPRIGGI